jgi:hypothetical protein
MQGFGRQSQVLLSMDGYDEFAAAFTYVLIMMKYVDQHRMFGMVNVPRAQISLSGFSFSLAISLFY